MLNYEDFREHIAMTTFTELSNHNIDDINMEYKMELSLEGEMKELISVNAQFIHADIPVERLYDMYKAQISYGDTESRALTNINNKVISQIGGDPLVAEYESIKNVTDLVHSKSLQDLKSGIFIKPIGKNEFLDTANKYADAVYLVAGPYVGVFHCVVKQEDDRRISASINNEWLSRSNISKEDLIKYVKQNQENPFYGARLNSLVETGMACESDITGIVPTSLCNNYIHDETLDPDIYILTNRQADNGASLMFNDSLMADISNKMNSSFYILPSSRHEIILVPEVFAKDMPLDVLQEMVKDINGSIVRPEDFLSDDVAFFDKEKKQIIDLSQGAKVKTPDKGPKL